MPLEPAAAAIIEMLEQVFPKVEEYASADDARSDATKEATAKHVNREALRAQLLRLREVWPALRERLHPQHLSGMTRAASVTRPVTTTSAPAASALVMGSAPM